VCTLDFIALILSTLLFIAVTFNPFLGGGIRGKLAVWEWDDVCEGVEEN